ncbi:helix-turn-helix domain-containing protein [Aquicella lusitana]|uniref:helix-turn-helix domain-containing protein n=1 Tax=Aquicella lusitana TaxID=254246 RepID=UPI000E0C2AAF|nr:helix-turn-helix transcriptional regulator [Aquicella lusitana]
MKRDKNLILIGKQIRKLRNTRGFSQENFANFIDMNRGYYGTIERGEANVTALNLLKIIQGLEVKPNDLFPPETYNRKFF